MGVPQNGWFIMENPIKMDDLGVPLFSETSTRAFRETAPFCSDLQVTTVVMPFVELLEPPPFAVGWCRIRMHDLTIEIPEVLRPVGSL